MAEVAYPELFDGLHDTSYDRILDDGFSVRRYVLPNEKYADLAQQAADLGLRSWPPLGEMAEGQSPGYLELATNVRLGRFTRSIGTDPEEVETIGIYSAGESLLEEVPALCRPVKVAIGGVDAWLAGKVRRGHAQHQLRTGGAVVGAVVGGYSQLRRDQLAALYSLADQDQPLDMDLQIRRNALRWRPLITLAQIESVEDDYDELLEEYLVILNNRRLTIQLGPAVLAEQLEETIQIKHDRPLRKPTRLREYR